MLNETKESLPVELVTHLHKTENKESPNRIKS